MNIWPKLFLHKNRQRLKLIIGLLNIDCNRHGNKLFKFVYIKWGKFLTALIFGEVAEWHKENCVDCSLRYQTYFAEHAHIIQGNLWFVFENVWCKKEDMKALENIFESDNCGSSSCYLPWPLKHGYPITVPLDNLQMPLSMIKLTLVPEDLKVPCGD